MHRRAHRIRRVLLALLLALAGCHIGPSAGKVAAERGPFGASGRLQLDNAELLGELLAVRDSELVVRLADGPLTIVPYSRIKSAQFEHVSASLGDHHPPTEKGREALRLASRFPQGLSPELEQRLLEAYGQQALGTPP